MKIIITVAMLFVASTAVCAARHDNPDRYPSLGLDIIKAQAVGILRAGVNGTQTNGGLTGFRADYRYPCTQSITLHTAGEALGINNNKDFTEGYRVELGLRVYFKD